MMTATPLSGFRPAAMQLALRSASHAGRDAHAVHGMHAIHNVSELGNKLNARSRYPARHPIDCRLWCGTPGLPIEDQQHHDE